MNMRPKVKITLPPELPSVACRDFGVKFAQDLHSLLHRSLDVMTLEIGLQNSLNCIMSALAASGVDIEDGCQAKSGTFLGFVEGVMLYRRKEKNEREANL